MKGSSSARLPALNPGPLVTGQTDTAKKKKEKRNKGKENERKVTELPKINEKKKTLESKQQEPDFTESAKRKLKLTVFLPDGKEASLEEKKIAELEAHLRRAKSHYRDSRQLRDYSVKSLQKSRLLSAKSRDHLMTLFPSKDDIDYLTKGINKHLVNSAKRELDLLQKHQNKGTPSRREISEVNTLFKQSRKAAKVKEYTFGMNDKTNNSILVDHVIDSCSRRAHVLAPIPVTRLKRDFRNSITWVKGQCQNDATQKQNMDETSVVKETENIKPRKTPRNSTHSDNI